MPSRPASSSRAAALAIVALVTGLVCLTLWRVIGGTEPQAYAPGATPPDTVALTRGHDYKIAVPGGVDALAAAGVPQDTQGPQLQCEWSRTQGAARSLTVQAESAQTKATDVVGTFTAPVSGQVHVGCPSWGTVFVPDADDAGGDPSGWLLLASTVFLLIGGTAALSAGWSAYSRGRVLASSDGTGDGEKVERRVRVGDVRIEDGEVGGDDRSDVGA